MKRVVIGLSGGVDSSVAAYLLKQQGYDVVALFMINWHDTTGTIEGDCPWNDDLIFAELVARKLDIPFHSVDLSEHYRKRVVEYMFSEYEKGRTPNPDVLCNREIKFDVFMDAAKDLGADYVATGHYCRKATAETGDGEVYSLLAGKDTNKDQSYFLCQLTQEQLKPALFPIGELIKPEVRKIAAEQGFATAERKDSQGICFVGKVDLPVFLQQKLEVKRGRIIEIPRNHQLFTQPKDINDLEALSTPWPLEPSFGKTKGVHNGAHFFTIGQRKGLDVGGTPMPLYVIGIDVKGNYVYVGQGDDHPGLYRKALFIKNEEVHWVRPDLALKAGEKQDFDVRIRYRQPLQKATVHCSKKGLYVVFEKEQRGITAGQFAAWYSNEELIGSGVISS